MRTALIIMWVLLGHLLMWGSAGGVSWQELLDRADALAATGELDSARVVVDMAVSKALTEYGRADTTVEIRHYSDGNLQRFYLRSYAEAESLYIRVAALNEKIFGNRHPEVAASLHSLGVLYFEQGRYAEAESLYERALAIRERGLGREHPDVAANLNSLGILYKEQGRYAEAESLYERSIAIREKVLGPQHSEVAAVLNNLGALYKEQGKYSDAEPLYKRALTILEKGPESDHPGLAATILSLAILYHSQGEYGEAEPLYRRSLVIREEALGSEHPDVAAGLLGLANLCCDQGEYADAESLYECSLAIREKVLGPEHPDVAATLLNLAILYRSQGKYAEAEPLYERALAIKEKAFGPEHLDVVRCLYNLAGLYWSQGKYADAEVLYERSLAIEEKALGPKHPDVASSLLAVGMVRSKQGKYVEAEPYYERALAIREKALGPEHPAVAKALTSLGILYWNQGRYAEAEPLYARALVIREKVLGPEHPDVATTLLGLAALYWTQGRYAEAEPLHERALDIREKTLGPEHPDVAVNLINLAGLYWNQGRYAEAEPLYRRSLAIREKVLGPEHPAVAVSLAGLALACRDQGKYAEAESLSLRALHIHEQAFGPDHLDVAASLLGLAFIYWTQGKYAEAEPLYKRSVTIRENTVGPEHPDVAMSLLGLAILYANQGTYAEAERLYRRTLAIREKTLGPDHPEVAECLEPFSQSCCLAGKPREAMELAGRAFRIRQRNFRDGSIVMAESDALTYSRLMRNSASNFLSAYFNLDPRKASADSSAGNVILSAKGEVSDGLFERRKSLVEETDSTALAIGESLRLVRYRLSELFVRGPGRDLKGYRARTESLSTLAGDLQTALARHSASFRRKQAYKQISTAKVASLLPGNSVLVEYVRYDRVPLEPDPGVPHYLALVIAGAEEPAVVDLGGAAEIEAMIDDYRAHILRVSSGDRLPTVVDQEEYEKVCRRLCRKLWKPIEEYVTGTDLVLIAPDGALNTISFAGLINDEGKYLVEASEIHYLSCGRDLIRLKDEMEPASGLFALGDPDYDAAASTRLAEPAAQDTVLELAYYVTRNVRSGCGGLEEISVSPLPGTKSEVEEIVLRWQESTGEPSVACFGTEASEDRFKAEAPDNRVIHLATHGYYLEGACRPDRRERVPGSGLDFVGENPLLLSGLFFAGANLHGDGADSFGAEDGILTAYEVSAMDLEGTELVVLSACETGLGKVEEGEGVYGLRRAFQMAGARTVISALWPVSDEATADMMSRLYERKGESIPETMRRIQLTKIEEMRQAGKPAHPLTWAGFIAVGDWE